MFLCYILFVNSIYAFILTCTSLSLSSVIQFNSHFIFRISNGRLSITGLDLKFSLKVFR